MGKGKGVQAGSCGGKRQGEDAAWAEGWGGRGVIWGVWGVSHSSTTGFHGVS